MRTIRVGAVAALTLASVACGGGGDDAPSVTEPAVDDGGAADVEPSVDPDGGIIGAILRTVFGLPPGLLDDDEHSCMNERLAPVFPDGVPDDVQLTEELAGTIDAVADDCDVELGG